MVMFGEIYDNNNNSLGDSIILLVSATLMGSKMHLGEKTIKKISIIALEY
jgi:hypothetical protein